MLWNSSSLEYIHYSLYIDIGSVHILSVTYEITLEFGLGWGYVICDMLFFFLEVCVIFNIPVELSEVVRDFMRYRQACRMTTTDQQKSYKIMLNLIVSTQPIEGLAVLGARVSAGRDKPSWCPLYIYGNVTLRRKYHIIGTIVSFKINMYTNIAGMILVRRMAI